MNKEILPPSEAQRIGLKFLQAKYYNSKVTIDQTNLVTDEAFPVYHLEGDIKTPSQGMATPLIYRATVYTFKMQVHAVEGSILNYELR